VEHNHWTYLRASDRKVLWGGSWEQELLPAEDVSEVMHVIHKTYFRPRQRVKRQFDYYRTRDRERSEFGTCVLCKREDAAMLVPKIIERLPDGRGYAAHVEACPQCAAAAITELKREAETMGLDLEQVERAVRSAKRALQIVG
jgi:hypothetical protein